MIDGTFRPRTRGDTKTFTFMDDEQQKIRRSFWETSPGARARLAREYADRHGLHLIVENSGRTPRPPPEG
jgi:hypothetical protein